MADTIVAGLVYNNLHEGTGLWGPYWIDTSNAVVAYLDNGQDISISVTDDGGATWTVTEVEAGSGRNVSAWFDQETPGDTGDKVHIIWNETTTDVLRYVNYDIGTETLGTVRNALSLSAIGDNPRANRLCITKSVSGRLYVGGSDTATIGFIYSEDEFATAGTSATDVFETAAEADWCLLFPADTADNDDIAAVFHDRSSDILSVKMYDASADTWTETNIDTSITDKFLQINYDGAVRHSDKHILLASHTFIDDATDDLRTYDLTVDSISSPTITTKTDVFTNQVESGETSVFINQQNDDVYFSYLKGGTWLSSVDLVYHKSTDGMGTWGSEQAYSELAAGDLRLVQAGRTVGDNGGRFQPVWNNRTLTDLYVNLVNDVEIAAAGGGVTLRTTRGIIGSGITR